MKYYKYTMRAIAFCMLGVWLGTACSKQYDDSELRGRTTKLEQQVSVVETNMRSLQTLVEAQQARLHITAVETFSEGVGGYIITLSNGKTLKIYNGAKGADGSNGVDGRPGRDGVDGRDGTPGRDGVDGKDGAPGRDATASTNPISSIDVTHPDYILFALADGSSLKLPRKAEMSFTFNPTEDFPVFAGQRYEIPYTTMGLTSESQIKVIAQDGYKAKLFRTDESSGHIDLIVPTPAVDSEVIVLLTDGKGSAKMYAMAVYAGKLTTNSESYLAEKSGGTLRVLVSTNSAYEVEIPSEAQPWLSYETLRALTDRTETLQFTLTENPNSTLRSTVVKLKSGNITMRSITIAQKGESGTYNVPSGTSLEARLNGNIPYELKLTGKLTPEDFRYLVSQSSKIRILDLSDLDMTELPSEGLQNIRTHEVKLPHKLSKISAYLLSNDSRTPGLQKCLIPSSVQEINSNAFYKQTYLSGNLVLPNTITIIDSWAFTACVSLTGRLFLPNSLVKIGAGAFGDCTGLTELIVEGTPEISSNAFVKEHGEALSFTAVYAKSENPRSITFDAFWGGEAYGAKPKLLYVPIGCKAKYEALQGWNVFERIEEMPVEQMPQR